MSKRTWLNLALLALVMVLALLAYRQPGIEKAVKSPSLLALSAAQVQRIRLGSSTARHIDLSRTDEGWMLTYPIHVAANAYRVDRILQLAQADSYAEYPAASQDLTSFGLAPPHAVIRFNDVDIGFGDSEPIHHRRYVLVEGKIHLIADRYYYFSQLLLPALVDTALLPAAAVPVRIQLPDRELIRDNGDWHIMPAEKQVSMDAINGLVNAWRHARAVQVSAYHGDRASDSIKIAFADGSQIDFAVLARSPELVLGRSDLGIRYHLTAEQARQLLHPAISGGDVAE